MTMVHFTCANVQIAGLGFLVMASKGQLLHECSTSVVHGWSGLSCKFK